MTASSWKNKSNSSIGGIGLLLSPSAIKSLIKVEKLSPRIISANFNGNPITTVVSCYSPTNVSDEDDVSEFYNNMSSFTRYVLKHNVLIMQVISMHIWVLIIIINLHIILKLIETVIYLITS